MGSTAHRQTELDKTVKNLQAEKLGLFMSDNCITTIHDLLLLCVLRLSVYWDWSVESVCKISRIPGQLGTYFVSGTISELLYIYDCVTEMWFPYFLIMYVSISLALVPRRRVWRTDFLYISALLCHYIIRHVTTLSCRLFSALPDYMVVLHTSHAYWFSLLSSLFQLIFSLVPAISIYLRLQPILEAPPTCWNRLYS